MKQIIRKRLRLLGLSGMLMLGILSGNAYDFEKDGIYYNILSENEVEVTSDRERAFDPNLPDPYKGVVKIPSNVTYQDKDYSVTSIGKRAFFMCTGVTNIEIPKTVTDIGSSAFMNCEALTSIEIPNYVTSIGEEAFSTCIDLTSVVIGNSVTSIGPNAFENCSNLTSVVIGNSVTSIGHCLFGGCSSLTSIEIPNSVTSIGRSAFSGCIGLTSVVIPNSVTSIGQSAFYNCSSLTSLEIPNSVTSIGEWAFSSCYGLTSVEIPSSVTSIGESAFSSCKGLTSVTCYPINPPYCAYNAFYNCLIEIVYVPKQSIDTYKNADGWSDFNDFQPIPSYGNLEVSDFDILKNATKGVLINLLINKSISYAGFQFDVEMPEGLTITDVKLSDELTAAGFEADNSSVEGNPVRVISYKTTGNGVTTTDGIVTLTIKADANATEGEKTIKFTNAKLSSTGGSRLPLDDSSVTVTVKGTPVSAINVAYESGKQGDLYVDDTAVYSATVTPEDASDKSVTWSIEDPTVAQITTGDDNSKVTVKGLKIGETTLKAIANDGSEVAGTATIKVVATPISSVTISSPDNKTSIYPEETLTLTATVNPATATTPITYKWTSDNTTVAKVTDNAMQVTLTALTTGTANISVTATNAAGNVTSENFTVTVAPRPITSVTLSKTGSIDLYVNDTETLTYSINPSNATNPVIEWSSSQPSVAKVEDGTITALSLGTTEITLKASNEAGHEEVANLTVNVVATPAENIVITGSKYDLKVTEELQLSATVTPAETTYPEVEWSSSDDSKATVEISTGKVTAKAAGQVTITAKVKATPSVLDTYDITITELIPGDANDDGEVDVADVVTIVNDYLGVTNDRPSVLLAYDFNNNKEADENDWKRTADIILGQVATRSGAYSSGIYTELASDDNIIVRENHGWGAFSKKIELELTHSFDYVAMSIEVLIPEGACVESVSKGNKLNNHSMAYNVVDGNRLKIAIYSLKNNILGNDRDLLNIELSNVSVTEHVQIDKVYATDSGSQRYSLGSDNDYAGLNGIDSDSDEVYHVFTIQGINVMNTSNSEDLEKLENGIYIINGKKVMINK